MTISCQQVGKHFHYQWVFRELDYTFESGNRYAVLGANGAGKSTLLRLIAGQLTPSEGNITYQQHKTPTPPSHWYQKIAIAAPYLELPGEFTFREMVAFHFRMKPLSLSKPSNVIDYFPFPQQVDKKLKYYSSGMLQRVKLVLALFSDVPVILLDEPMTNLDKEGRHWYRQLLEEHWQQRLLIVCSNWTTEYEYCDQELFLSLPERE